MSAEEDLAQPADSGGPTGPIRDHWYAHEVEYHKRLEEFLARGEPADLQLLRDYSHSLFLAELFRYRPVFTMAWPVDWYIPGDADYRNYWFAPPRRPTATSSAGAVRSCSRRQMPAEECCRRDMCTPTRRCCRATPTTPRSLVVGALFRPSATLSYADVSIDADVVAHSRIWMLLAHPTANLPTAHIRCTSYVCVWHIDPVTGAWELVRPYGWQSLFNRSDSGVSGSPIQTVSGHYSGNALSTRVQVQAGHSYAVGFQAQVDIDADVRDISNQRYQRGADDDWKLWADLDCSIPQITIATTVLVPLTRVASHLIGADDHSVETGREEDESNGPAGDLQL